MPSSKNSKAAFGIGPLTIRDYKTGGADVYRPSADELREFKRLKQLAADKFGHGIHLVLLALIRKAQCFRPKRRALICLRLDLSDRLRD
jgi:hypothetical protein